MAEVNHTGVVIKSEEQFPFPAELRNQHAATLANETRTNNQAEGWNNRYDTTHMLYLAFNIFIEIDTLQ